MWNLPIIRLCICVPGLIKFAIGNCCTQPFSCQQAELATLDGGPDL